MVAVAVDEFPAGKGPERITFVISYLGQHVWTLEHYAVMAFPVDLLYGKRAGFSPGERTVDDDLVVDAPYVSVGYGAVALIEHFPERIEKAFRRYVADILHGAEILCHTVIERIVIHVAHDDNLDPGIFLHHPVSMFPYDFTAETSEIPALAAGARREMGHVNREILICNPPVHHEYVPCPEIFLFLLRQCNIHLGPFEGKRNRLAVEIFELIGTVKQADIDPPAVRTVIMHDFETRRQKFPTKL